MARAASRIAGLPGPVRIRALSAAIGRLVPFVGTARLKVLDLSPERAVVTVQNKRRVQNHIDSVHAVAMALIAESATGFVVGMNVPDDKLPLCKSLKVEYLKRATGDLRAEASLTLSQRQQIMETEKGDVLVACKVTDETGIEPIRVEIVWAWIPKKR